MFRSYMKQWQVSKNRNPKGCPKIFKFQKVYSYIKKSAEGSNE